MQMMEVNSKVLVIRLTTSETGITTSLFVKTFDASESTVVNTTEDKIYIPKQTFSTGGILNQYTILELQLVLHLQIELLVESQLH